MSTTETKGKRERVVHSAKEKAQAVLSSWTERRRLCEICREMQVTPNQLSQWQERAMEGILLALAPRRSKAGEQPPALSAKLERLLARKSSSEAPPRLSRRLRALEQAKEPEKAAASGVTRP